MPSSPSRAAASLRAMVLVVTWLACVRGSAASLDWHEPWRIPFDPGAAASASDEFAWRLFVALNWPSAAGAHAAAAWERWQNSANVYRADGADPGPWRADEEPRVAVAQRFESLADEGAPKLRHIVAGRMVSREDRLPNPRRLVEIRMNRLAFDYIRAQGLYNTDGQIRKVANREPIEFPLGAIEVKASWRPIRRADRFRYHTLQVRLPDGITRLYGLTALNIAAKESPEWFWASFEHIDNSTRAGAEGWRLASRDRFACRGVRADCGLAPAGLALEAGAWQHYRLRGTMTRYLDDAGAPRRLGNSELEAGFETTASCMTCHARSALAVERGSARRLEIFDTRAMQSAHVTNTNGLAADAGAQRRRGYVGVPDPGWFRSNARERREMDFQRLDFVWSLARAMPRRDVPARDVGDRR